MSWTRPRGDDRSRSSTGPEAAQAGASASPRPTQQPPALPNGLYRRAIATLDPGYFAWVMATGIVSVGTDLVGYRLLSAVVLGVR